MYGLVDCNNFYASCERIFNPKLNKEPVIVLSNNDGCVIARSNESKRIGIKMGIPAFKIKSIIKNIISEKKIIKDNSISLNLERDVLKAFFKFDLKYLIFLKNSKGLI